MDGSDSAPNGTNTRLPPAPPPRTPRRETHRVLYDFVGQNENEVTMKRGEHVLVTQGDTNGWSLVKMEAGVGWAPSEYLTELEAEPPPPPRFPAPSSTASSGAPSPAPLPPCDPCKRDSAECKRTSDVCDRCKEQGLLCRAQRPKPPPPSCQGWGRSARILFANEDYEKARSCIVCQVQGMAPGEVFCSRCKSNGIKPAERLPTSCYIPETEPPLGFRQYRAMKAASAVRACHTCYFAKIKCDEGKPGCSNCEERKVRCKYSRLLDFARPIPEDNAEAEGNKAAPVSSNLNTIPLPLSPPAEHNRSKCITCQHRKVKCDAGLPNCARCISAGRECVYEGGIRLPTLQESSPRPVNSLAAATGSNDPESHVQSFGDSSAARGLRDIMRERQAKDARRAEQEAKATMEPQTQFHELHLACGPCRKVGAHCTGFPSHTCKRCNDNNIECQITLRPAIVDQFSDSNTPKKSRLACDGCRRFLTYCDKATPTCSSCEARDDVCNYRDDAQRERIVPSSRIERKTPDSMPLDNKQADATTPDLAPLKIKPAAAKPPGQLCEDCKANGDEHDTEWPSCTSCTKLRSEYLSKQMFSTPNPFLWPRNKPKPLPEKKSELRSLDKPDPLESSPRKLIRKNVVCGLPATHSSAKSPTEQDPSPEEAADSIHSKSPHKPDPQEPREKDGDGDEWELIDEPELEDEIDAVLVEPEPQLTENQVGKEKLKSDSEDGKIEKEIRSNLDAWGHAADQPKLARWSGMDGEISYEGYIIDGVVLKSDKVDPEIVRKLAELECHVGQQKSESNSGDEKMEKEIDSNRDALGHTASPGVGRLPLLARATASDNDVRYGCEAGGYVIDRVVLKTDRVHPDIVKNRAKLDRIR